jgi:hypothetical protein
MPNGPIKLPAKHFLQDDPQEIAEAVYRFTQRGRYP